MKTKNVRLFMLCLIFTGFSFGIQAQTHLDALIKKCETLESVDMEVVKNKWKTEADVETKAVNIRISNDTKLVNEFLDAFKKDSPAAEQAMFRKDKGSINYYQCRFLKHTYTIVVKETGNASVTVGYNPHGLQYRHFSTDSLLSIRKKQRLEQYKEQMKQQQKRMEQHKEQMKQQQKRMEQHKERMKQYKLDSALSKYNIIADSLILKSASYINFVNWDSIASKFGKDMDSLAYKLGVGWDEIMERYDFE